ncbi:long-chain fatty acid--CoA ligase [Candidatus Omnitrophota bacterium]
MINKLPKNLGEMLKSSAQKYAHRVAVVFGRKKIDYEALDGLSDRLAAGLIGMGVKSGDRVALLLDNCPHFIISYYAVLKAGAIVVPINYMFKIEEAKYILEDSRVICLITSSANAGTAEELRLRVESLKFLVTTIKAGENIEDFSNLMHQGAEAPRSVSPDPSSLAVILYTSGTTGHPKGAMLTHYNLISNAMDSADAIKVTAKDSVICILPLFHSFAATVCMNLPLLRGAKIVVMKSVRPFKRVLRAVRKNRVSIFAGVPSLYNILKDMKFPPLLNTPLIRLFNPLRLCISGAAALPIKTFYGFERKFRVPLMEGYGLTEASPVVTLNPLKGVRKPGSIGIPLSGNISLRIVSDNGEKLKTGEVGELLVKGPNVMQGYYGKDEASRKTLKDGWLYTGDMAKKDEDGYFYIAGRKKDMVNVRGLNVYPREIEEVLYQNHKIKEAAVIGVADAHKGEVPKAFIVLQEGEKLTEHDILKYLRDKLAAYKIPKHIEFRTSLPKNTTGKILKRMLRYEENHGG